MLVTVHTDMFVITDVLCWSISHCHAWYMVQFHIWCRFLFWLLLLLLQ